MAVFSPVLEIICGREGVPGRETIQCQSNNQLVSVVCSFDGGPEESCSFPLVLEFGRFGTDQHTVVVNATDAFGQFQILSFTFQLIERKFTCRGYYKCPLTSLFHFILQQQLHHHHQVHAIAINQLPLKQQTTYILL